MEFEQLLLLIELDRPHRAKITIAAGLAHLRFYFVAQKHALVAQVELTMGYDRMRPTVRLTPARLLKAAGLFVALRARLDQGDRAAVFIAEIKVAIRVGNGAFAQLLLFLPHSVAGLKLL